MALQGRFSLGIESRKPYGRYLITDEGEILAYLDLGRDFG